VCKALLQGKLFIFFDFLKNKVVWTLNIILISYRQIILVIKYCSNKLSITTIKFIEIKNYELKTNNVKLHP
jgi:hypothetical protein